MLSPTAAVSESQQSQWIEHGRDDCSVGFMSLRPVPLMTISVGVSDRQLTALVDTGATASLIRASCCGTVDPDCNRDIVGLGGATAALGSFTSSISVPGIIAQITLFLVVPDSCIDYDVVLGSDFFSRNRIVVDYCKSKLRQNFDVGWTDVRFSEGRESEVVLSRVPVYASCDVQIQAGEVAELQVLCPHLPAGDTYYDGDLGLRYLQGVEGIVDFREGQSGGGVAKVLVCQPAHAKKRVEVIRRGTMVGTVSSIVDLEVEVDDSKSWTGERLESEIDLGGLSVSEIASVRGMLFGRRTVFSTGDQDIGCASVTEHRIELNDYTPIRQRPRRFPEPVVEAIEEQCRQLQALDIITPSKSAWSSPVVPIRKKDGTMRLCIDYRKVNAVTKPDRFPMPNMTDLVFSLHGMQYFTSLDLVRGYYQIPLAEQSQEITAFSTTRSHYQFKRLSFGLKNAPAAFQREMQEILRGYLGRQVVVYIDDILIMSRTFDEHLELVGAVLGTLCEYGIKVKVEKCQWFRNSVPFLGHVVGRTGLRKAPEYVQKVIDFPKPETVHHLRQFLGLLNFQRKFIPDCSQIAQPLTCLTGGSKRERLVWTPAMETAFERLKEVMARDVLLSFPDYSVGASPLELYVDASGTGAGACLMQVQRGESRAIAFNSMTFSRPQRQYSTIDRELAAIRWGIKVFRPFLYGIHFILFTDHRPLVFMRNMSSENSRIARTLQELAEFDFELRYCRGQDNTAADTLSRMSRSGESSTSGGDRGHNYLPAGLEVVECVPGGGDSMVESLYVVLSRRLGDESKDRLKSVEHLRGLLVDEVFRSGRTYGRQVPKLRKGEITCMKRPGRLMPEVALVAASSLFGLQIWVHCGMERPIVHAPPGAAPAGPSERVHLQWLAGVHYNPVEESSEYIPSFSGEHLPSLSGEHLPSVSSEHEEFENVGSSLECYSESVFEANSSSGVGEKQLLCKCSSPSCSSVVVAFGPLVCCALVDTGAQVSLIREDVFALLPDEIKRFADMEVASMQLKGVGGGCSPVKGVVRLLVTVAGRVLSQPHPFAVVSEQAMPYCVLLGANFIASNEVRLDFATSCVSFGDKSTRFVCSFRPQSDREPHVQFCFQHELVRLPGPLRHCILAEDELLGLQRQNRVLVALTDRVLEKTVPEQWRDPSLLKFRRFADSLFVHGGVLYCDVNGEAVPVVSFHFLVEVLMSFHCKMAHIGRHKLLEAVGKLVWHPDLYKVANEVCVTCRQCQLVKVSHQPLTPPIVKIETSSPFELVSVDMIDFPRTPRGFKTVLMVVDHFSKWLVSVPLKDKKGETVAHALEHRVLPVLPRCPIRLLSDNGPEFRSAAVDEVLRKYDVEHTHSTPYCPSSNGGVERVNRTIAEFLRGLGSGRENWDLRLPQAVMVYNATLHRGLDRSPSSCLLSQAHDLQLCPRLPADVRRVWRQGHPRFAPFAVGQKVLYRIHQPGNLTVNKLKPKFSGPFVVTRAYENGVTYVIRRDLGGLVSTKSVHYKQLKVYHEPPEYLSGHPSFQRLGGSQPPIEERHESDSDSDDFPVFVCGSDGSASSDEELGDVSLPGGLPVPPVVASSPRVSVISDGGAAGAPELQPEGAGEVSENYGGNVSDFMDGIGSPDSFRSCPCRRLQRVRSDPALSVSDSCLTRHRGKRRKKRVRARAPLRAPFKENLAALPCSGMAEESPFSSTAIEILDVHMEDEDRPQPVLEVSEIGPVAGSERSFLQDESSAGLLGEIVKSPVDLGGTIGLDGVGPGDAEESFPGFDPGIAEESFLGFGAREVSDASMFDGFSSSPRVSRLRDLRRIIQDARTSIAENRRKSLSRHGDAGSGYRLSLSPRVEVPVKRIQTRSCGPVQHVQL